MISDMAKTFRALLLTTLLTGSLFTLAQHKTEPPPAPAGKITASAIWQPSQDFLNKAKATCDKTAGPASFGDCFLNQIAAAGAPADAVSFTRALFHQTDGQVGIMSAFRHYGPVDAAQVFYPLRANDNYGVLLVNGDPAMLDVDDFQKLDRSAMQQDTMFQAVKTKFPQTDLWPGDRSGSAPWPRVEPLPGGDTRFVVSYPLINGCHACRHVGVARFGWDFDAQGKFLHTTFIPTPPPPKLMRPQRPPPPQQQPPPPSPSQ